VTAVGWGLTAMWDVCTGMNSRTKYEHIGIHVFNEYSVLFVGARIRTMGANDVSRTRAGKAADLSLE